MKKLLPIFAISILFLSACATTSVNLGDDREYFSESEEACEKIEFECAEGTKVFSDATGCGCEDIDEEESNIILNEELAEEPAEEEPAEEEPAEEEEDDGDLDDFVIIDLEDVDLVGPDLPVVDLIDLPVIDVQPEPIIDVIPEPIPQF